MKRIYIDYLNDILNSIQEIESFTLGINYQQFFENRMIRNAVIRSLEVLGEASKGIPDEIREKYPQIPWKRISGMRDKLSFLGNVRFSEPLRRILFGNFFKKKFSWNTYVFKKPLIMKIFITRNPQILPKF